MFGEEGTDEYVKKSDVIILAFVAGKTLSPSDYDAFLEKYGDSLNGKIIIAAGTKVDRVEKRAECKEEAQKFFTEQRQIPYFETSAKTGEGVEELFDSAVKLFIESKQPNNNPDEK